MASVPEHEHLTLEYAGPRTPSHRRLPSVVFALSAFAVAGIGFVVAPPYYGSGIMRPNPLALVPATGVWLLTLVYIWRRTSTEHKWPCFGLRVLIAGSWIAATAMPIQAWIWINDAGTPQSRWRRELALPLAIALTELLLVCHRARDNPPMQRTGAAGIVSVIRKLLERGSGR